ncbi:MAG: cystathionine gamma-synthase [Candidatus Dormibacteria bacterium]
MSPDDQGFETKAIHAGQEPDPQTGAVVPPIHLATTYRQAEVGVHQGFEYSRTGNPTRAALERQLAALEGAAFGRAFASGLAAEDAVIRGCVPPGGHLILPHDAYGGTYRLVAQLHARAGLDYTVCDLRNPAELESAFTPQTALVWVETPSNPLLAVLDIAALAGITHQHGARLLVDNTFATPYLQRPLSLGADLTLHSTTKYLGGHSDVVGGFVAGQDLGLDERLGFVQNAAGAVPSPFDCFLVQRGIKTLAVRMERHCASAQAVADFLAQHPRVVEVNYPGLPQHPGHALAQAQMRGFGGMVSFRHAQGEAGALAMVARTRLFSLAESLGAVESLIEHPGRMTHASVADSPLRVPDDLVRLSVGLETSADLLRDLDQALDS